jgi:hypothetical protein
MATINRVLYSAQTALISVGGKLSNGGVPNAAFTWVDQGQIVGGANVSIATYLLPVQTASADETIPQEDVLVLGVLAGVGRLQKDAASSKCSIKAYLASSITVHAGTNASVGTTDKAPHGLAGKSLSEGAAGLLETLREEAIGGYENRVTLNRPGQGKDGFMFHGVTSNISIDCSKGALPTIDLAFEGTGQVQEMYLTGKDAGGLELNQENAGDEYIDSCVPHTHADVQIWGYERDFKASGEIDNEVAILIAADSAHGNYGDTPTNVTVLDGAGGAFTPAVLEGQDTLGTAKLSFDMPTETLTALGEEIVGKTIDVREGNRTFSKPPFKATLTVDGNGTLLAGWGKDTVAGVPEERVVATTIVLGNLVAQIDKDGAATSARSFSQNVGDVGASYSVTVEGTDADFESN